MKACWSVNPDDRPNFTQLAEVFGNMLHTSVTEVRTKIRLSLIVAYLQPRRANLADKNCLTRLQQVHINYHI